MDRAGVRVAVHRAPHGGLFAWLWRCGRESAFDALLGWGFYSFVLFRHVSFVVESAGACPPLSAATSATCCSSRTAWARWRSTTSSGAATSDRLRARGVPPRRADGGEAGTVLWLARGDPVAEGQVAASSASPHVGHLVVLFFRAACGSMGIWNTIEGGALFLGVRLRPNFRGVLTATNPSQFWRAWRGTMTNWLIRYVYIPLGGNRRHQTFNIFGAFVVSTVWHCLGIPFLRPDTWTRYELGPDRHLGDGQLRRCGDARAQCGAAGRRSSRAPACQWRCRRGGKWPLTMRVRALPPWCGLSDEDGRPVTRRRGPHAAGSRGLVRSSARSAARRSAPGRSGCRRLPRPRR